MPELLTGLLSLAMAATAAEKVDKTAVVATDVAAYFLFDPEELAHRRTSPMGWVNQDFACGKEFAAGNIVAFDTGGDGAAAVRVTNGELTPREKAKATGSWPFRLRVRHGRVLLDGGLHVPSAEVDKEPPPEDLWVTVPNGDYQVTVHPIDRSVRGGDFDKTLPEYVLQLRPVKRLDAIKVLSKTPPRLIPGEAIEPRREKPSWANLVDDTSAPVKKQYLALVKEGSPVTPGTYASFELSEAAYNAVSEANEFVVVSGKVPGVGVLARDAGGGSSDGKWEEGAQGLRLVKITSVAKGEPVSKASVAPLNRPAAKVLPKDMTALKDAFAKYAKSNVDFRKTQRNPDYQAERVSAIESSTALTNLLLNMLPLPAEERAKLLPQSDAGRIRGIKAFLESATK